MTESPRHTLGMQLSAAALLLGIFASGTFAGAALYRWGFQDRVSSRPPTEMRPPMLGRELGLSAEQQKQFDAILHRYHPELEAILRETFPRVKAVREKIDSELRQVLNEEQRRKFDAAKARRPQGLPPIGMMGEMMGGLRGRRLGPPPDMPELPDFAPPGMPVPRQDMTPGAAGNSAP